MRRYLYYISILCFVGAIMMTPLLYFYYSDLSRFNRPIKTENVNTYIPPDQIPLINNIYKYYYTKEKEKSAVLEILSEDTTESSFSKSEIHAYRKEMNFILSIEGLFTKKASSDILQSLQQDTLILSKVDYDSSHIVQVQLFLESQAETSFKFDEETSKIIQINYQTATTTIPDEKTLTNIFTSYVKYLELDVASDWTVHDMNFESYQLKAQIAYTIDDNMVVLSLQPLGYQKTFS